MARESKAEKAKRVANDNFLANEVTPFEYESDLFGLVKIGENLGPVEADPNDPGNSSQGWDIYDVEHSGVHHRWASGVIVAVFGGTK